MSLLWIVLIVLLVLGGLAYVVMTQMPDVVEKQKKEKKVPPPAPVKDWQGIAERLEKRIHNLEQSLQSTQAVIRDKDKQIAEMKAVANGFEHQMAQEKVWREKEEAALQREKKREQALEQELNQTRDSLNTEQSQKIRLEYETKELRSLKEMQSAEIRKFSGRVAELEKSVNALSRENKELKAQNVELQKKKEADQWVAKDDFVHVEKLLKRARFETELFKKQVPVESWPRELRPKAPAPAVLPVPIVPDKQESAADTPPTETPAAPQE